MYWTWMFYHYWDNGMLVPEWCYKPHKEQVDLWSEHKYWVVSYFFLP